MDVPRLRRVEAGSMRDRSGYKALGGYDRLVFVYDPLMFASWIIEGQGAEELIAWVKRGYSPPIISFNNYIWVLSPGPEPIYQDYQT
jgi:hypothetical protein